jgi:hypothetical protein
MFLFDTNSNRWLAAGLAVVMAVTRFHHEGTPFALPDASLAVFFLAGWYFRSVGVWVGYLILAFLVDYAAIRFAGVSAYCITPAYGFLVPTYGALWWAGRWARQRRNSEVSLSLHTVAALVVATTAAFLISNGSFFLFSGRVSGTGWTEYGLGIADYYPGYLGATLLYCGTILGLEKVIQLYRPFSGGMGKAGTDQV